MKAKGEQPQEFLGIPARMCLRCGMVPKHDDCIAALRDRIADMEFQISGLLMFIRRVRRLVPETRVVPNWPKETEDGLVQ